MDDSVPYFLRPVPLPNFTPPGMLAPATPGLGDQIKAANTSQAQMAALPAPQVAPFSMQGANAMPALPVPALPSASVSAPLTHIAELNRLQSTGAGDTQIQNPFLRGLAETGNTLLNVAGSIFHPLNTLAQNIPGTSQHHNVLVAQQQQNIANDLSTAQQNAQIAQTQATTRLTNDKATDDETPAAPATSYQRDAQGNLVQVTGTSAVPVTEGDGTTVGTAPKDKPIEEQAYEAAMKNGMSPLDAYGAVYGAKNQKSDSLPQQYLDAMSAGDTGKAQMIRRTINDTQTQPKITILNAGAANRASASTPSFGNSSAAGDAYIASLPPQMQQVVKSTAAGDIAIPPAGTRNKDAMAIREAVLNYDPTYTDARYKGVQQFKTGGDAQNVQRLGTAMLHATNALQNSASMGYAPAFNTPFQASGDATYKTDADFLAGELGQFVTGGKLTVDEGNKLSSNLYSSRQSVRDSAINEMLSLAGGKLETKMQGYKTATGMDFPADKYFDTRTQGLLQQHGIIQNTGGGSSPQSSGYSVGQKVTLKNGSTVTVSAVHPDGSFDAN